MIGCYTILRMCSRDCGKHPFRSNSLCGMECVSGEFNLVAIGNECCTDEIVWVAMEGFTMRMDSFEWLKTI